MKGIYQKNKDSLRSLQHKFTLSEVDYHNISRKFGHVFEASIGAEAIDHLLSEVDLTKEINGLKKKLAEGQGVDKKRLSKRLLGLF